MCVCVCVCCFKLLKGDKRDKTCGLSAGERVDLYVVIVIVEK